MKVASLGELPCDEIVVVAAYLPIVDVGLVGIHRHHLHGLAQAPAACTAVGEAYGGSAGTEEFLEMDVSYVAAVMVAGDDRLARAGDAVKVAPGLHKLFPVSFQREVARHDHQVGLLVVDDVDTVVHQRIIEAQVAAVEVG